MLFEIYCGIMILRLFLVLVINNRLWPVVFLCDVNLCPSEGQI